MFQQKTKTRKTFGIFIAGIALTLLVSLSITPTALAGEFIEGQPDANLAAGQVVEDDLFIAGENVSVAGTVEGDLFAVGETIEISGNVSGNVIAAGQSILVSGSIDGALMVGGYQLVLQDGAEVSRNVYFGGFSLETESGSLVDRSIYAGGYQLIHQGEVGRDITAGLGALDVSGPVGGDLAVEVGEPSDSTFMPFTFMYPGAPEIRVLETGHTVDEGSVGGEVDINVVPVDTDIDTEIRIEPGYFIAQAIRRRIGEFIALMLVGLLAIWLAKGTLLKAVEEVKHNAGKDTLWGLLVYVLYIPVVFIVFLLFAFVCLVIGLLTLGTLAGEVISISSLVFFGGLTLFGLLTTLGTKIVIGYLVGRWVLEKLSSLSFVNYGHHAAALALGIFLYEVLRAIPVFGWLVMIVVAVIGMGAFFVLVKDALSKKPGTTVDALDLPESADVPEVPAE